MSTGNLLFVKFPKDPQSVGGELSQQSHAPQSGILQLELFYMVR